MMTPDQQNRLEKIRALLAKAESTTHPEEAKAFSAKAQELMAKWAIDDAMLNAGREDKGQIERTRIWIDANEYRAPKVQLLIRVAENNDCKLVLFPQRYVDVDGKRKRRFPVEIVGFESDRRNVEVLYTSLLLQSEQELLRPDTIAKMQIDCIEGGHRIRWRNSFMMGYAMEIGSILHRAREYSKRQAQQTYDSNTMALVLVGRMQLVEAKYAEFYPKLGKAKCSNTGRGFAGAHHMGMEAATRADIGRPKVGGNRGMIGN